MSNPAVSFRSNFPQTHSLKPVARYQLMIENALEQFKCYDAYFEAVPKIAEEARRWGEVKEPIEANEKKKEDIAPRFTAAVKKYIEFDVMFAEVKRVGKVFQETMDYCYPNGALPNAITQELVFFFLRLGVDVEPIKTQYNEVLAKNFEQIKERNRKMKNLQKDMSAAMESLKKNLEAPAKLCAPSKYVMQTLLGPVKTTLDSYLEIAIKESAREAAKTKE